ncbi:hypothetical protein NDU88_007087 [Pleurodeles waltl]|uniref:Helix-turn-helix domain-containing protein n=1 Tax=Pleurodeles waltl TaxID=8319 RepID=A0AAV7VNP7_PLEWA|nr:hypothetical protein NDU88_007087 [Pleurodeles waltl]
MTIGDNKLPFLDLLIYEHDGGLATEVYYKPTDRNNLLQFQSFHPRALKDNLPVGQFLRLRQNCLTLTDYRKHADKLATKLQAKDYPTHLASGNYNSQRPRESGIVHWRSSLQPEAPSSGCHGSTIMMSHCELQFPVATGIRHCSFALQYAAGDSFLGLPRKYYNDEPAVPVPTQELCFQPPRPPDDETTGCAVITHTWPYYRRGLLQ